MAATPKRMKRILIVDEEPEMRELLSDFLGSQWYSVECLFCEAEALRSLREGRNQGVDALIYDLHRVPLRGLEFLRIVRRDFPGVPVILLEAFEGGPRSGELQRMGVQDCLAKPFSLSDLGKTIQNAIARAGVAMMAS